MNVLQLIVCRGEDECGLVSVNPVGWIDQLRHSFWIQSTFCNSNNNEIIFVYSLVNDVLVGAGGRDEADGIRRFKMNPMQPHVILGIMHHLHCRQRNTHRNVL